MTRFEEVMVGDPPRLFIVTRKDEQGKLVFGWGLTGQGGIPHLNLLGALVRCQADLGYSRKEPCHACPAPVFVIVWCAETEECEWFVHDDIPTESLLGMIELVKHMVSLPLLQQQAEQQAAQRRQGLLGPDGFPIYRGPGLVR